nr:Chain P, Angiotensin-(1-7) [synthetic construct]
DRVYIHP